MILVWAFWWVLAGKIGIKVWFLFVRQAERSRALGRGGGVCFWDVCSSAGGGWARWKCIQGIGFCMYKWKREVIDSVDQFRDVVCGVYETSCVQCIMFCIHPTFYIHIWTTSTHHLLPRPHHPHHQATYQSARSPHHHYRYSPLPPFWCQQPQQQQQKQQPPS